MASINSWVSHFRQMGQNKLPPGSIQVVRKGSGVARTFYCVSPTNQALLSAHARVQGRKRSAKPKGGKVKTKKAAPRKVKRAGTRRKVTKRKTTRKTRRPVKRKTRRSVKKDIFSKK